jgi:hypothetical protein
MSETPPPPPDRLNEIGLLKRREIEARIIGPLVDALGEEFGRERVVEVLRRVIVRIAHQQGAALVEQTGGNSLEHFSAVREMWQRGSALEIEPLAEGAQRLHFNVTRCRYAEMYRALGIPELGAALSCNRDFALIQGFNPNVKLTRTQTLMNGADFCDFRYEVAEPESSAAPGDAGAARS